MARHRGKFDKDSKEPYELSRSRIENFVRCKACFYMEQVEGIKFPSIPGFNINEATEIGRAHVRTPVTSQSRMPSSA